MKTLTTAMTLAGFLSLLNLTEAHASESLFELRESFTVNDQQMPLITSGMRKELWVDVYRCGIYTSQNNTLTSIDTSDPIAVTFLVQTDLLPDTPPKEWREALSKALTPSQFEKLSDSFADLDSGERLTFIHDPRSGTSVRSGGGKIFTVTDIDLIETILDMLIGPDPVSTALKDQLL